MSWNCSFYDFLFRHALEINNRFLIVVSWQDQRLSDRLSWKSADHLKMCRDFYLEKQFWVVALILFLHARGWLNVIFDFLLFVEYLHLCVLKIVSLWHLCIRKENHLVFLASRQSFFSSDQEFTSFIFLLRFIDCLWQVKFSVAELERTGASHFSH